jgi:hypothetical protein
MICDGDVSTGGSGGERAQKTIARDSAARHGSARAAKASWEQRTTVDRESGSIALRVPRRQLWPARLARVCAQAGGQGAGRVDGATTHEAANLTFSRTAVSFVGKPVAWPKCPGWQMCEKARASFTECSIIQRFERV